MEKKNHYGKKEGKHMRIRTQQYYRLNRLLKKSYHARIRAGEPAGIYETYRQINEEIVALFAHGGLIGADWAAALGHTHTHEGHEAEKSDAS